MREVQRISSIRKVIMVLALLAGGPGAQAQIAPFLKETLVSGIQPPSSAVILPNNRMMITQLRGTILITSPLDQLPITTSDYLEIPNVDFSAEHGLVEILLDPDFANNNYFYVYYSTSDNYLRLSRFQHLTDSSSLSTETVIFQSHDTYSGCCHTGGMIFFLPDGTIALSIGDDFAPQKAQQLDNSFGKIHRINTDGSIPVDNPFYDATPGLFNSSGVLKSIYAYGLRNPFRGCYDAPRDRFLLGSVGGNDHTVSWEDLYVMQPGANYGWPFCGDVGRDTDGMCSDPQYVDPFYTYAHNGVGAAIVPGFVYAGTSYPQEWVGRFFYADYARWEIRYMEFDAAGDIVADDLFMDATIQGGGEGAKSIAKMLQGPDGALYYISIFDNFTNYTGSVSRITYRNDLPPVCQSVTVTPLIGPGPTMQVQFDATATDPEGLSVDYEWYFGDGSSPVAAAMTTHTYTAPGVYEAQVLVGDTTSTISCGVQEIVVGQPPTVTITSPLDGSLFQAGQTITFEAQFSDDGPISQADLEWEFVFNHDDHIHPDITASGVSEYDLDILHYGHDYSGVTWYTATVTATDAYGLTSTHSIEIFPDKVDLTILSDPPGMEVLVGGLPQTTPFTTDQAIGMEVILSVSNGLQCINDTGFQFQSWSNGGPPIQYYYVPGANDTVTAVFSEQGPCQLCGTGLQFDGVNDVVSVPELVLANDLTLEMWFKPEADLGAADVLLGNNSDVSVDLEGAVINVRTASGELVGSIELLEGYWQHVAIVRNNGVWAMYVNGMKDLGITGSAAQGALSITRLGRAYQPAGFHGMLDEVRVWDVARSGNEIQQNMVNSLSAATSGLRAYWKMDQQLGLQSVPDASGNGNVGVLGASSIMGNDDPKAQPTEGPMDLICQREIVLGLKAFLQGPYKSNNGLMSDSLRVLGLIPLQEPYTQLGMTLPGQGGEVIAASTLHLAGNDAIVDWILVELRDQFDPAVTWQTIPLLIQRDGDIVGLNGVTPPSIHIDRPAYHIVVQHRNHLGVMTATPLPFGGSSVQVDFSDPATPLHGTDPMLSAGDDLLLWAGDITLDGALKYAGAGNDRDPILIRVGGSVPTAVTTGYYNEDVNMDGTIRYTGANNDRDTILVNIGGSVPTNFRLEQVP